MNEPVLLGFGIIVLMVGWHFIVRKTALDTFRDHLFDLRESVRQHYLENGYSLEDRTYAQLRMLINDQIRFLEQASFTKLSITRSAYDCNKDLREWMDETLQSRFKTEDEKLAAYIKSVRIQAHRHVANYLVCSSLGLSAIVWTLLPIVLIIAIVIAIAHKSFKSTRKGFGDLLYLLTKWVASRDAVEKISSMKPIASPCS